MGAAGITDDVEKFERVLTQLAGERYAEAFRLRYIALAPKMERSSTKSTQVHSSGPVSYHGSMLLYTWHMVIYDIVMIYDIIVIQ